MNILGAGRRRGEIYANALIEKEKDDLTEGDRGESRGNIKMKKDDEYLSNFIRSLVFACVD